MVKLYSYEGTAKTRNGNWNGMRNVISNYSHQKGTCFFVHIFVFLNLRNSQPYFAQIRNAQIVKPTFILLV